MKSCGMSLIKYFVFAFNGVFALSGLAVLIAGIVVLVNIGDFKHFLEGGITTAAVILIVAGVIVFLVAFLGCFAAVRESRKLLFAFAGFILLIFILEIIAGILAAVCKGDIEMTLKEELRNSMANYSRNEQDRLAWEHIQRKYTCCGIMGPQDWLTNGPEKVLPPSCCHALKEGDPEPTETQCRQAIPSDAYVFQDGCFSKLHSKARSATTWMIWLGLGIGIFQIVGIILTIWLAIAIKNETEDK